MAAPAEASGMGALEGANETGSSDEAGKTAVTSGMLTNIRVCIRVFVQTLYFPKHTSQIGKKLLYSKSVQL